MMKQLAIVLVLAASPAQADLTEVNCARVAEGAEGIMYLRQNGYPLGDLLAAAGHTRIGKTMILDAWETPAFPEGHRERVVNEFRDAWHVRCLRQLEDASP